MRTHPISLPLATTVALCGMLLAKPCARAAEHDTLNASDTIFVEQAAASNLARLKMAALGVKKAVAPEVKSYAATLVTFHTKSGHSLTKLAATKSLELFGVVEPAQADAIRALKTADASSFDSNFLVWMVNDHKACLDNFEKVSMEAEDPDVKAFATETLPTLQAHLKKGIELSLLTTNNMNTARNERDVDGKSPSIIDQVSSKSGTENRYTNAADFSMPQGRIPPSKQQKSNKP